MRYPEEHKRQVGARIVAAAAEALRQDGLAGPSIPAVMRRVGLTHGSFYCHFRDRDELVAEAVRFAAEQTAERVLDAPPPAGARGEKAGLAAMLDRYLSREHRDHPEVGCVVAAVGTEGRRQGPAVQRAFGQVARGFLFHIQRRLQPARGRTTATGAARGEGDDGIGQQPVLTDEAIRLATRMVGALVLARLVDDPALSDRILEAARTP